MKVVVDYFKTLSQRLTELRSKPIAVTIQTPFRPGTVAVRDTFKALSPNAIWLILIKSGKEKQS